MFGRPWQAYRSVEVYDDLEYFRMTDLSFSEPALYDLYDKLFFGCNGLGLDLAALVGKCGSGRPGDCGDLQLGSQEPQPQEVLLSCLGDL